MKLTYWCAAILNDRPVYNIRARTRAEAKEILAREGSKHFGKVTKIVVEYHDAFDLATKLLSGGSPEPWE